jgi:hypothetical protein
LLMDFGLEIVQAVFLIIKVCHLVL